MADAVGFTDFQREADGRVTALKHADGCDPERVNVRVSVESQIERADGTIEAAKEVASSDVPEGLVGSVRF